MIRRVENHGRGAPSETRRAYDSLLYRSIDDEVRDRSEDAIGHNFRVPD